MVTPADGYTSRWLHQHMVTPAHGYTSTWLHQHMVTSYTNHIQTPPNNNVLNYHKLHNVRIDCEERGMQLSTAYGKTKNGEVRRNIIRTSSSARWKKKQKSHKWHWLRRSGEEKKKLKSSSCERKKKIPSSLLCRFHIDHTSDHYDHVLDQTGQCDDRDVPFPHTSPTGSGFFRFQSDDHHADS